MTISKMYGTAVIQNIFFDKSKRKRKPVKNDEIKKKKKKFLEKHFFTG